MINGVRAWALWNAGISSVSVIARSWAFQIDELFWIFMPIWSGWNKRRMTIQEQWVNWINVFILIKRGHSWCIRLSVLSSGKHCLPPTLDILFWSAPVQSCFSIPHNSMQLVINWHFSVYFPEFIMTQTCHVFTQTYPMEIYIFGNNSEKNMFFDYVPVSVQLRGHHVCLSMQLYTFKQQLYWAVHPFDRLRVYL